MLIIVQLSNNVAFGKQRLEVRNRVSAVHREAHFANFKRLKLLSYDGL